MHEIRNLGIDIWTMLIFFQGEPCNSGGQYWCIRNTILENKNIMGYAEFRRLLKPGLWAFAYVYLCVCPYVCKRCSCLLTSMLTSFLQKKPLILFTEPNCNLQIRELPNFLAALAATPALQAALCESCSLHHVHTEYACHSYLPQLSARICDFCTLIKRGGKCVANTP